MSKRYTQEEKEYMAEMAIEIVQKLDGHYPSFKNYVWVSPFFLGFFYWLVMFLSLLVLVQDDQQMV